MKFNIEKTWYSKSILSILLLPLSWLFRIAACVRRSYYKLIQNKNANQAKVIVVGNITVGGAGKTPFVSYLASLLQGNGLKVGVVSRGYGRENEDKLIEVLTDSEVLKVGDEALMLKQQLSCPIVVAANRVEAVQYLNDEHKLDVIISDDGLQHYKMYRDYEIIIVDGEREFGNGFCLPAGPLREPISRLKRADIIVSNGENGVYEYQYTAECHNAVSLLNHKDTKPIESFNGDKVHAIAGIGNPQRFFAMLKGMGLSAIPHVFPDHYAYTQSDLIFNDDLPVLMTEKDAVKCRKFTGKRMWYLPIKVKPNHRLEARITELLEGIK